MYLYVGKVEVGGLSGYLWLLGMRLYFKTSWRPRDTYYLGNLSDPLAVALRLKRLAPKPVDVRKAVAAEGVVDGQLRGGKVPGRPHVEDKDVGARRGGDLAYVQHAWPWTAKHISRGLGRRRASRNTRRPPPPRSNTS